MRKFWSLIHGNWPGIRCAILGSHASRDARAHYIPCDPDTSETHLTVEQDVDLCKRYHSLRILPYLKKALDVTHHPAIVDALNIAYDVHYDAVDVSDHPYPA